jgi:hypothetical protein
MGLLFSVSIIASGGFLRTPFKNFSVPSNNSLLSTLGLFQMNRYRAISAKPTGCPTSFSNKRCGPRKHGQADNSND